MTVINFDDLPQPTSNYAPLPNYDGFTFSNIYYFSKNSSPDFAMGVVSSPNAIFQGGIDRVGSFSYPTAFELSDAFFSTPAGNATAIFSAYNGSTLIGSQTAALTTTPTDIVFSNLFANITRFTFNTVGPQGTIIADNFSINNKAVYNIGVDPAQVAEGTGAGNGGVLTYTVNRSGDTNQSSIVDLSFSGTATPPGGSGTPDYSVAGSTFTPTGTGSTGVLSFAANQTKATFTVTSTPDSTVESDETVIVTLADVVSGGGSVGVIGTMNSATGTIQNDDAAPVQSPSPAPTLIGPTPGDDNLVGTDGNDTVSLLAGNDTYSGGLGNDLIYGNQGNDLVYGNQGNDLIYGGQDNDTAFGGQGDDTLFGNQGNDVAYGNIGNDIVYGNQGDDVLYGGQGNDTLYGGMGNDTLFGGKGDDVLVGGQGNNTFGFNPGDTDFMSGVGTGDTIADFVSGTDKIDFTAGPAASAGNFGSGAVAGGSFAQLQAAAQQLISGGKVYAFETDGVNGYLFTSAGGPAGTIEDAVKLSGANTAASVKASDIVGGPVAMA